MFVFHPQQIVALEISDPFDNGESGLPVYIFVQIIERIKSDECFDIGAEYGIKISETEEKVVDSSALYEFMSDDSAHSLSVVLYEGLTGQPNETAREKPEPPLNQSLDEIITELKRLLKEAWSKLTKNKWKLFIKRQLFRWHPDKNPGQETLCTKVFQILQNLIAMLVNGENIDDFDVDSNSAKRTGKRNHDFDSSDFFYGFNFNNFRERAKHYRRHESSYYQNKRNHPPASDRRENQLVGITTGIISGISRLSRIRKVRKPGDG